MPSRAAISEVIRNYSDRDQANAVREVMRRLGHDVFTDEALRAIASKLGRDRRHGNRFLARHRAVRVSEAAEPV